MFLKPPLRSQKWVMGFPYWQNWRSLLINGPFLIANEAWPNIFRLSAPEKGPNLLTSNMLGGNRPLNNTPKVDRQTFKQTHSTCFSYHN